jgi:hypothetical protein
MKTFRIVTNENKFLETITYTIYSTEIIDGKRFTELEYEFEDFNRAKSKCDLLNCLYN